MLNIFEVGGCVRDEILGVNTNDIEKPTIIFKSLVWIEDKNKLKNKQK